MSQLVLTNDVPLIGDFLGTIPAMIELSMTVDRMFVVHHKSIQGLFDMIPRRYRLHSRQFDPRDKPSDFCIRVGSDATEAYWHATKNGLYMTQAHYSFLGLSTPIAPVRPQIVVPTIGVPTYDYVIAPFSVSLPPDQRWPQEHWNDMVRRFPHRSFALIGSEYSDRSYVKQPNVTVEYGRPFTEVARILQQTRFGLISVVNGMSHLAYALGVKNVLLESQDTPWGLNPESIRIHHHVCEISVNAVCQTLALQEPSNG